MESRVRSQQYLDAGLVDEMQLHMVPTLLGRDNAVRYSIKLLLNGLYYRSDA